MGTGSILPRREDLEVSDLQDQVYDLQRKVDELREELAAMWEREFDRRRKEAKPFDDEAAAYGHAARRARDEIDRVRSKEDFGDC